MSRHIVHLVRTGTLAFVLTLSLAMPALGYAAPNVSASHATSALTQADDIVVRADGAFRLAANAPNAPPAFGSYSRFGLAVSSPQSFQSPFSRIQVEYQAEIPTDSQVLFDVRVSADGIRWSPWEIDLPTGAVAEFSVAARYAQYRTILLGNVGEPTIQSVTLTPQTGNLYQQQQEEAVAPTWRIRGTRQGMVGGRTASGHIIQPHDRFVSLPSRRVTSRPGGFEYLVRISYNGRSTVVPVLDVGPWNVNDNYWDENRDRYKDLPRGYPEDHAAYYDNYNNRMAEKGWVRFPTAVDIGDGAWQDDLGIRGDQAWVEVTFLWLGTDPLASPTAEPTQAPEPTAVPAEPTEAPTEPSVEPTVIPVEPTAAPTEPTAAPVEPTAAPVEPTVEPTTVPVEPTAAPVEPTKAPEPTVEPTKAPEPTVEPTKAPEPTVEPTKAPEPTVEPTATVTPTATVEPTVAPTQVPEPTVEPTQVPEPTVEPTQAPEPTAEPTATVTPTATVAPEPTIEPTAVQTEVVVEVDGEGFSSKAEVEWYHANDCGVSDETLWTYTTDNSDDAENSARWQPDFSGEAAYDVYVHIPDCDAKKPETTSARYQIQSRDGKKDVVVNQSNHKNSWVHLGRFSFTEGGFVEVHDVTGDSMQTLWIDAVKWVPAK